ncbi:Gfo/Idh/MocA family protein [Niabella aquatica]
MEQVNWGIIGCGDVTEVKSGPAFNKVPHSRLVAVMRRNAEKAADYAHRHGVQKSYSDAQALINDPDVNAIYIATPPSTHLLYALAAMQAGKPVYVEKPMAMNASEARQMTDYAQQRKVKLSVAHYRRELPLFLKIKSLIDSAAIGDIRFADLKLLQSRLAHLVANTGNNWRMNPEVSGGGLFHDLAPHQIDLMLYLFGSAKHSLGYAVNQSKVHKSDDLVTGTILFKKDILFTGTWCFTVNEPDARDICTIYGSRGNLSFGFFGNSLSVTVDGRTETLEFDAVTHVQQPMIEKVVRYFSGKGENPCDGAAGVETMMLMDSFCKRP